jgi:hypothetical protein
VRLTITRGPVSTSAILRSDLVLQNIEGTDRYLIVSDPHAFFSRPSEHGDMLWEELGFRCKRRRDEPKYGMNTKIMSIDDKNMLILHLLFDDVVNVQTYEQAGRETISPIDLYSIANSGKSSFAPWIMRQQPFSAKFDFKWLGDPLAEPEPVKLHIKVKDWLPENSVYLRKKA